MTPTETALRYVAAIGVRDVEALCDLMTDDHRFVDSMGSEFVGREALRVGWRRYYELVPDFAVTVDETFERGDVVVLMGKAVGIYTADGTLRPENRWSTPAAWRVVVRDGKVAEWRVFADNEPIRRLAGAASA